MNEMAVRSQAERDDAKFLFPSVQQFFKRAHEHASPSFATASLQSTSLPWEHERELRFWSCVFLQDLASRANLPDAPLIAAQLLVQRFFVLQPFDQHDRFLVATAALFLTAKTEEFPVKVRILTECALYLTRAAHRPSASPAYESKAKTKNKEDKTEPRRDLVGARKQRPRGNGERADMPAGMINGVTSRPNASSGFATTTSRYGPPSTGGNNLIPSTRKRVFSREMDPEAERKQKRQRQERMQLDCLNALLEVMDVGVIEKTVKNVLLYERILLQTLEFTVGVSWPQNYLVEFLCKVFQLEALGLGEREHTIIRQVAWMILADSIRSGLSLAFDCCQLAAGSAYLSCLFCNLVDNNVTTDEDQPWWSVLGYSAEDLEAIVQCLVAMFGDEQGKTRKGLPPRFGELCKGWRPQENMPDVSLVRRMDAEVLRHQDNR